jgi:hypothetical protein
MDSTGFPPAVRLAIAEVVTEFALTPRDGGAEAVGCERGYGFMLHVTCDWCGKEVQAGDQHFVVKIEVFAAQDPAELTEADLDEDHMEAVSQLLQEMDDLETVPSLEPVSRHLRYDLCLGCRSRYLRDPLCKEAAQKFHFSEN